MEKKSSHEKDSTSLIKVRSAALLLMALEMVRGSPCSVTPQCADCNRQSIVNIPQDLPNSITCLYLDDNLIESVEARDLQRLGQLEHVRIDNNQITSVDVEAFAHLTQLLKVHLSHNKIRHVTNTLFTKNTKLTDLWLNGNNLRLDPASPFLISTSIEYLQLKNCGIFQVSKATFSKMDNLKFLIISENNIMILDSASFHYNPLRELSIDPAEEIKFTLSELSSRNVTVTVNAITKPNLASPKEIATAPSENHISTSATRKENVTSTVCDKKTVSLDTILVLVSASLVLVTIGFSVTVLLLYWRKQKSKTGKDSEKPPENDDKPEGYTSPEYGCLLYDGYEDPQKYSLVSLQPVVLHPQRILPYPPLHPPPLPRKCSRDSYHEYEEIQCQ